MCGSRAQAGASGKTSAWRSSQPSSLAFALIAVATGGEAYLDLGGVILLFVIGGVIGLIVYAIYERGRRDATMDSDEPRGPIEPE